MDSPTRANFLERFASRVDQVRDVFFNLWKLGSLMVKGAFLVGERKRLMMKLGEQAFERIQKNELVDAELDATVQQLNRVNKKLELEERLVRNARFGSKSSRLREEDAVGEG